MFSMSNFVDFIKSDWFDIVKVLFLTAYMFPFILLGYFFGFLFAFLRFAYDGFILGYRSF